MDIPVGFGLNLSIIWNIRGKSWRNWGRWKCNRMSTVCVINFFCGKYMK
jgi:hypothetical protein